MTATQGFIGFLVLTVVLLALVVVSGLKAKRRRHLTLVFFTVVSLAVTIYWAEQLGEEYDLESAGLITPVHLWMAKLTVAAYLLPVVTGLATLRDQRRRKLHGKVAFAVLALTLATFVTGLWMILASQPLAG